MKLVYKNFPLNNHSFARQAALAAIAAKTQGKFWDYHDRLFANSNSLSESKFQEIAAQLGLDQEKFNQDLKSPASQEIIERDMNEGRRLGIKAIPTVYVNGRILEDRSPRGFQFVIDDELSKKEK